MQVERFPGKSWLVKISHGVCVEESHGSAAKTITGGEESHARDRSAVAIEKTGGSDESCRRALMNWTIARNRKRVHVALAR